MSLVARCPHCASTFRVQQAQLSHAGGWVRCGVCGSAFDAGAPEPGAPPLQALPDIDLELPDLGALQAEAAPPVVGAGPEAAPEAAPEAQPGPQPEPQPMTEPADRAAVPSAVEFLDRPQPGVDLPPTPAPLDPITAIPRDLREGLGSAAPATAPALTASPSSNPSGRRWGALLLALALTLLLLVQVAYGLRGWLAQTVPASRPWIIQACDTLGCQRPALRALNDLAVESTSLSHDDESGEHRLRLSLRNPSDLPIVVPALELTLTDAQSQVLARRVLMAEELGASVDAVPAGGSVDLLIRLDLKSLNAGAISSFQLQPFYP